MNIVDDVLLELPFDILISNFSASDGLIPKEMIIGYAVRSPLALISLTGPGAQEMCGVRNIFPTTTDVELMD